MTLAVTFPRALAAAFFLMLGACSASHWDPPAVAGRPALVNDAGKPRLWVLTRQEEERQVSVGGSSRSRANLRSDTFFHFDLQAFDPETARPLWKQRLLTLGDDEAVGTRPSRVIGSGAEGAMLGQEGDVVWLLLDGEPWAVGAGDGKPLANGAALEERNPGLKGVLPGEAKFYGFDRGLVVTTADARQWVIRGAALQAEPYVATPTPTPAPVLKSNGSPEIVPLRLSLTDEPSRLALLDGRRIGLYTDAEAADAANDELGTRSRYPYTVLDQGLKNRRRFWLANTETAERFDESFERFTAFTPIEGVPGFLGGRFLKVPGTDDALMLDNPVGVLVWHSTRIDRDGRLALTRLDEKLKVLWTSELPMSESNTVYAMAYWPLPGRILVLGTLESLDHGVTTYETHLATVQLSDGARQAWNIQQGAAVP